MESTGLHAEYTASYLGRIANARVERIIGEGEYDAFEEARKKSFDPHRLLWQPA